MSDSLPEVTTRVATPEDDAFLFRVFQESRAYIFDGLPFPADQKAAIIENQFEMQRTQYRAAFPEAVFSVVLCGGEPVGLQTLDHGDDLRFVDMALLTEHCGRGIGSRLFNMAFDEARRDGKRVFLSVDRYNHAQNLYHRLGFKVVREDPLNLEMMWEPPVS